MSKQYSCTLCEQKFCTQEERDEHALRCYEEYGEDA